MRQPIVDAIRKVAPEFGLAFADVAAFVEVESRGSAYEPGEPLLPKMLFERHIFYRQLPANKRARAVSLGLANREWQRRAQYADQKTTAGKRKLFHAAANFGGVEAACASASWGLMQTMGFNHDACGFESAAKMVEAYTAGIDAQIRGALHFLKANRLLDDIKAHRWDVLAEGYNGSGYRANAYDKKLAAAHAKYSRG